jgi:hypothetical protein
MSDLLLDEPLESAPLLLEGDDSLLAGEHAPYIAQLDPALLGATAHPRRLTPNEKRKARTLIATYCAKAIATKASKHYSQARPMTHLRLSPELPWTADCSGFVTGAYLWADMWTPFPVEDPNRLGYNGYGFTGTLLAANFHFKVPDGRRYFVGDVALFGPPSATRHTTICRKGGTATTSVWASHGNEAGPYDTRLHYRRDLLCVVRPWSLR